MLRRYFARWTDRLSPAIDRITANPTVQRYFPALADPDLWHLNRRSAARAVAVGLFCGLIPGPLQALGERRAVMLGDSVTADIGAAVNAGVDSILFTNGAPAPAVCPATHVAATLEAAAALL